MPSHVIRPRSIGRGLNARAAVSIGYFLRQRGPEGGRGGAYVRQLNAANVFRRPIRIGTTSVTGFFPAEGYHQDFLVRNTTNPYIVANDFPKLRALKATFPAMVKSGK